MGFQHGGSCLPPKSSVRRRRWRPSSQLPKVPALQRTLSWASLARYTVGCSCGNGHNVADCTAMPLSLLSKAFATCCSQQQARLRSCLHRRQHEDGGLAQGQKNPIPHGMNLTGTPLGRIKYLLDTVPKLVTGNVMSMSGMCPLGGPDNAMATLLCGCIETGCQPTTCRHSASQC